MMNRDNVVPLDVVSVMNEEVEDDEAAKGFSFWCLSSKSIENGVSSLMKCVSEKFQWEKKEEECIDSTTKDDTLLVERPYAFRLNAVLIGESGVGKSSIAKRFAGAGFSSTETCTIGIEFHTKAVEVKDATGRVKYGRVKLNVWDTSGQESFASLTKSYYRSAILVYVVFDLTNRSTFSALNKWLDRARELAPNEARIILVGNKSDNAISRQVTSEEALNIARKNRVSYLETSAKTGRGVKNVFHFGCRNVWKGIASKSIDPVRSPGVKELM